MGTTTDTSRRAKKLTQEQRERFARLEEQRKKMEERKEEK